MKRIQRLTSRKSFTFIYNRGKSVRLGVLSLVFVPSKYGKNRYGFSVGKKVGKAVRRNKVKRRLKEIVTALIPEVQNGYNLIIAAHEGAYDVAFAELEKQTRKLLAKANVLKADNQKL